MTPRGAELEVLTSGRVSVDLYPEQIGVPLAEVRTFRKMLGGSPTNVAVAAARLGPAERRDHEGGRRPVRAVRPRGAARASASTPTRVGTDPDLRTPIVFCEIFPPDHFPLLFYREPKAPDLNLTLTTSTWTRSRGCRCSGRAAPRCRPEPSRGSTLEALAARRGGDHRPRPRLPADVLAVADEAGRLGREALSTRPWLSATSRRSPSSSATLSRPEVAQALLELGPELAIVKLGAHGVLARSATEQRRRAAGARSRS